MPDLFPDVNRLSWQNRDNPNLIHSESGHRGKILGYITERGEVTHQELIEQFGKPYLEEALTGLFDRCQLDFAAGKYFVSPQDQWRPRPR